MVFTSCNTSYNVGSLIADIRGGEGGGGKKQKKDSPDFRFPEVGISAI